MIQFSGLRRLRLALTSCMLFLGMLVQAQQISRIEYFTDTDPGFGLGNNVPFTAGQDITTSFSYNVNSLPFGFHSLYIRSYVKPFQIVEDEKSVMKGGWSLTSVRTFYKENLGEILAQKPDLVKAEYFLDTDPGFGAGTNIQFQAAKDLTNFGFVVPLTGLDPGFHNLYVRFLDKSGSWSMTAVRTMYKEDFVSGNTSENIIGGEYFIDSDPGFGSGTPVTVTPSGNLTNVVLSVNLNTLDYGFHSLFVRFRDSGGNWGLTNRRAFYKENLTATGVLSKVAKLEYFIDKDPGFGQGTVVPVSSATDLKNVVFEPEIDTLSLGDHVIYLRAMDEKGIWSLVNNSSFRIEPPSGLYVTVGNIEKDLCIGATVSIPFTTSGKFSNGNIFTAQLSDAAGSFDNPVAIGTLSATGSGTITGVVPNRAAGSGYRVRIVASDPEATSTANNIPLAIHGVPPVFSVTGDTLVCFGTQEYTLSNHAAETGDYAWSLSGGGVLSADRQDATVDWNTAGTFELKVKYNGMCAADDSVKILKVTVVNTPLAGTFRNLLPANQANNLVLPLTFSWSAISGAVTYDLYIWPENESRPDIPAAANLTTAQYLVSNPAVIADESAYSWQVIARRACYELASPVRAFSTKKVPETEQTIDFTPIAAQYVKDTLVLSATASSGLPVTYTLATQPASGVAILTGGDTLIFSGAVGQVTITASQVGNDTYKPVETEQVFNVIKRSQEITFGSISPKTLGDPPFNITATATSGLPVTFVVASGPATVSGRRVTLTAAGTVVIEARQAGNALFDAASSVQRSFAVQANLPDLAVKNVTSNQASVGPGDVVTVSWEISNEGAVPASSDWTERIYIQSSTGENRTQIKQVNYSAGNALPASGNITRSDAVTIPAPLNVGDQAVFVVEVLAGASVQEAPGTQVNNTSVQQNNWSVKKSLAIAISASQVTEGAPGGISATVNRTGSISSALSVNVSLNTPSRFSFPASVTIPAGQAGVSFTILVPDNSTIEPSATAQLQASASGYQSTSSNFTVLDNDLAVLSVSNLPANAMEGQTVKFRITTSSAPAAALTVYLQSDNPGRFPTPPTVTIPAGETNVEVSVNLAQDNIPEIDLAVSFTAGAANQQPVTKTIRIDDDDLPNLELVVKSSTLSESGGLHATKATLRRTSVANPVAFTANLSASLSNTLVLPASVSLAAGENEKTFDIGVVENTAADGQRQVTVTASVFVASCGCNTPPATSGSVSTIITINDNDGAALLLTAAQQTLPEGLANAGLLRITRNTPVTAALTVNLASSETTEATLPPTAQIPAGRAFVDVPIATLNDGVTDGNQQVYFTASANGFSQGTTWIVVTDLNKPDLQIPAVQLSSANVPIGTLFDYQVSIKNSGSSTVSPGTLVRGYLSKDDAIDVSDIVISEDIFMESVAAGQTKVLVNAVKAPVTAGDYKLLFQVNPDGGQIELLLTNNVSDPVSFQAVPGYTATVAVTPAYVLKGTNISIAGSALRSNGSPAANTDVEVYVITSEIRRALPAVTDGTGKFSVQFAPLAGEAGHYIVGASAPGLNQTTEQDAFDILGVSINDNTPPRLQVTLNEPLTGSLKIQNLSSKSLANFTLAPVTLPGGATVQFSTLPSLAGNATANLNYSVTGSQLSVGNNFEVANLQAKSDEGNIQSAKLFYYCQAANGFLVANVTSIQAGVSQSSGERQVEFTLINRGKVPSGEIEISIPTANWIKNITPKKIASLAPGDTAAVVLGFYAVAEVPFDYAITGNIGINAVTGNSFTIPFTFKKVAEATGMARVTVTNQFTYYTENGPKVKDAFVTIKNYFTSEVYAEGYTNADGIFEAGAIPEGKHRITVEKDKHLPYSNVLEISPGNTVEHNVFLNYQAITFSWTVEPSAIQDQYEVVLESEFETNVPLPVVTIEMPKTMPQLAEGQKYPFYITLTNHGLITAENVTLEMPTDPEYEFITNYIPSDLPAQQSIQVPAFMRRKSDVTNGRLNATQNDLPCMAFTGVIYTYKCVLATGLWERNAFKFTYPARSCPNTTGPLYVPPVLMALLQAGGEAILGIPCKYCPVIGGSDSPIPEVKQEKASCVKCISDMAQAVLGCIPGTEIPALLTCVAGAILDGTQENAGVGMLECDLDAAKGALIGLIPGTAPITCILGIIGAIKTCSDTDIGPGGINGPGDLIGGGGMTELETKLRTSANVPAAYAEIVNNLEAVIKGYEAERKWMTAYFADMLDVEGWSVLFGLVRGNLNNLTPISDAAQINIMTLMAGYEIQPAAIQAFFVRWNKSIEAKTKNINAPNAEYPDIINWTQVNVDVKALIEAHNYAVEKGYLTIDDMHRESVNAVNEIVNGAKSGVCASVTVQFKQQVTMTREAFEGTLEISNGHPTEAMKTIAVNLLITDENGTPSNGLFEIQTKNLTNLSDVIGGGEIDAQQKGSVKFLFIPERGAAPTSPKIYNFGGSITYWDPYADAVVTMPLSAVPITVNPSPNLMLHYFMQRNILGDDALTSPDIEPSVPAELAVMVENNGYGPAVNMTISSAQPKIVDNEKGLAINFNLVGTAFQGQQKQLSVTNINFGTVPGLQTRIGQWYFTSSLLGKFVSYEAKVVHSNSFGNPDLSLVQDVRLHELTKSIRLYGPADDGIDDFLVNDIFDVNDRPDIIYYSQGNRTARVRAAASGSFNVAVSAPSFTNTLTVTPADTGFNYIKLDDPGSKLYELASITRNDGQVIPLSNAWLTFVTLPVSRSPVYENKFHIVDHFGAKGAVTYTVVWKPLNTEIPRIDSISGAPAEVTAQQVTNLRVYFNKHIDPATFTYQDLNLTFQGGPNIINSSVVITAIDSAIFDVDLSAITTGNGFYNFTAQAANVKDMYGTSGQTGKQATWSQFLDVPIVQAFLEIPPKRVASAYDVIRLQFNLPIDLATAPAARFSVYRDGKKQPGTLVIDSVTTDHKLFSLSGLGEMITESGTYEFRIDLPNIKAENGVAGIQSQSLTLVLDVTGPSVTLLEKSTEGGIDPQHIPFVNIRFNEGVVGLNTSALRLTRNGELIPLNITQLAYVDPRNWTAGNFGMATYPEGNYVLTVNLANVIDSSGNAGSGTRQLAWKADRTSIAVTNLTVGPDLGFSATDGVTSGQALTVGYNLSANASQVTISQVDLTGEVVLMNIPNVQAGSRTATVNVNSGGNTKFRVTATGAASGSGRAEKEVYIDQRALFAKFRFADNQRLLTQVNTIPIGFSAKLLNTSGFPDAIALKKNGALIPGAALTFEAVNDTLYNIKGISNASAAAGSYELTFDIQNVAKHSSGKTNAGLASAAWTVLSANRAPVANAGADVNLTVPGNVQLSGTGSSDPDEDGVTYSWVAPEGITLDNADAVSPTFAITDADRGKTLSFLLVVSDGELFSTDVVLVKLSSGLSFSGLKSSYCITDAAQTLTGTPTGGVFSGPGIAGNVFDPSAAGAGTHTISYLQAGETVTQTTTVHALPNLGADKTLYIVCENEKVDLTDLFDITGLTAKWDTDTPAEAGAGTYQLIATNSSGCKDTVLVTVKQKIAIWTGAESSDWFEADNWDIGMVPSDDTHVVIPPATAKCEVGSDVSVASIKLEKGSRMKVAANAKLTILTACEP